jgi:hypothetical protein
VSEERNDAATAADAAAAAVPVFVVVVVVVLVSNGLVAFVGGGVKDIAGGRILNTD